MKIIIYEDHEGLRANLSMLIDGTAGMTVVGVFPNCKNVATEVKSLQPDLVLMDIEMPEVNGIEGVERIKLFNPNIAVLMHTVFDDNDRLFAALEAGADSYMLKKTKPDKLIEAIQETHRGGSMMTPSVARRLIKRFNELHLKPTNPYGLSSREAQILKLLTEGYGYKGIAADCFISMDTVSTHLRHIYNKLHVNCATAAVAKAIKERLV
jgi:DNA-binding NarL/FixJ family response regulator